MEIDKIKDNIVNLFSDINKNLINEDEVLKLYTNKFYAELANILNNLGIKYSKYTLMDLINTYIFYQGKAKLNIYKSEIQNINENMKNFFDRGVSKGFNELECNAKTEKYLNDINKLNSKVVYDDIFVTIKKVLLTEFNFENQQFIYQLDNIINTNKSLLETEIVKIRSNNISICKSIGDLIIKLGKTNTKTNLNIDNQVNLIEKLLLDINIKNQTINKSKLNGLFSTEASELSQMLGRLTRNISDRQVFIKEIIEIFSRELESTYINFYDKLNKTLIPNLLGETLVNIQTNKMFNVSRNPKMMNMVNKFSNDNDLVDMDVVFANIEELLMTKYGLSRSHPSYMKISKALNLEKAKLENSVGSLESHILLGIIIELQAQIDKILNHRSVGANM